MLSILGFLKLPLVFIGKAKNPRWINPKSRNRFCYYQQNNSWMEFSIWEKWFLEQYVPTVSVFLRGENLPEKSILFCDNCSAHGHNLSSPDGNHVLLFLPPLTTGFIQPMDQEVISNLKMKTKGLILDDYLNHREAPGEPIQNFVGDIDTGFAIHAYVKAWEEISVENLQHAWKPLLARYLDALSVDIQTAAEHTFRQQGRKKV